MLKRILSLVLLLAFAIPAAAQQREDWDRAISLFNQKQYRPSIREFHAVLKTHPDYYQAWYYIGAAHYQLQGYEDAIDALNNYATGAAKDEKGLAAGYYFVGLSHYQLKQYDKAASALAKHITFSEKLQQNPEASARAALGRSYIFTDKFAEAIPVLTAATAETKTDATNYYYLGFANYKLGRTDPAITALKQGLTLNPKEADMLYLLGSIYLSQIRLNQTAAKLAITTGEQLLAVRDDERSWNLLGQSYLYDQQYAKAAPLLDKYARAHADSGTAWFNVGLAYSRSSQWKPAAAALEQATKITPNNLNALLELGYVYESDKQYDNALTAYQRAYAVSGQKDETARTGIERVKQAKP